MSNQVDEAADKVADSKASQSSLPPIASAEPRTELDDQPKNKIIPDEVEAKDNLIGHRKSSDAAEIATERTQGSTLN